MAELPLNDNDVLTNSFIFTYCQYCKTPKPPRCHHCHLCKICVLRFDHHSILLGKCVGIDNNKAYILHMLYSAISIGISIYVIAKYYKISINGILLALAEAYYLVALIQNCIFLCKNRTYFEYRKKEKNVA